MPLVIPLDTRLRLEKAFQAVGRIRSKLDATWRIEQLAQQARQLTDAAPAQVLRQGTTPRVLFLNLRCWHTDTVLMAILGRALMARGAHVSFLACGGGLPMCNANNLQAGVIPACHSCAYGSARLLESFRLPYHVRREFVSDDAVRAAAALTSGLTLNECTDFIYKGLPVGQMALVSAWWMLCRESLDESPRTLQVFRGLVASSIVCADWFQAVLTKLKPDIVFMPNALWFAERILGEVTVRAGRRFVTSEGGLRADTDAFAHDRAAGFLDHLDAEWPEIAKDPLSREEDERLDYYQVSRQLGGADVGYVNDHKNFPLV